MMIAEQPVPKLNNNSNNDNKKKRFSDLYISIFFFASHISQDSDTSLKSKSNGFENKSKLFSLRTYFLIGD